MCLYGFFKSFLSWRWYPQKAQKVMMRQVVKLTSLPFAKKYLSLFIQRYESKSVNAILRLVANKIMR